LIQSIHDTTKGNENWKITIDFRKRNLIIFCTYHQPPGTKLRHTGLNKIMHNVG